MLLFTLFSLHTDRYKNRPSYLGRLLVVILEGKSLAARDSGSGKNLTSTGTLKPCLH